MSTTDKPMRADVLTLHPPELRGSDCGACGRSSFPNRELCPHCGSDSVADITIRPHGTVVSWTTVRQAPPPTETPYTLATVDLDNDIRVLGRVEGDIEIGTEVTVDFAPIATDSDDDPLWWYHFRPQGDSK